MMNLELSKKILKLGIQKAQEKGISCSIALADAKGWLVALHRMDGAPLPTAEMARDKAWTAAVFRRPSSEVSRLGDPNTPGYGFNVQNWNDRLTTIPGGFPIWESGDLIGAIGICSQTPREDVLLCKMILKDFFREKKDLRSEKRRNRKTGGRR